MSTSCGKTSGIHSITLLRLEKRLGAAVLAADSASFDAIVCSPGSNPGCLKV